MIRHRENLIEKVRQPKPHTGTAAVLITILLALPQIGFTEENPSPSVEWGRDLYMSYCVSCHGWAGKGDGPAGLALKKTPADLTQLSISNGGDFPRAEVKKYIDGEALVSAHGSREMPVWGKAFRRETSSANEARMQIFALTAFIESIQSSPSAH